MEARAKAAAEAEATMLQSTRASGASGGLGGGRWGEGETAGVEEEGDGKLSYTNPPTHYLSHVLVCAAKK